MVELSHEFLKPVLHAQAICIDATIGNGKDSMFFLNQNVRKVYGFEIQEDILEKTKEHVADVRWIPILEGHEKMMNYVHEEVDAILFNFGYCPNGNETITTLPSTSLEAVKQALMLLKRKGRLVLVLYPHQYGNEEQETIESYLETLSQHDFQIYKIQALNVKQMPYMIGIEKR